MNTGVYLINGHYWVSPALNQVQDQQTGRITHLEPRIMAVLEHLSRHSGQLVTREEMIHDIWNNYGGGDEGLSQAISFLRKILGDHEKNLIQTIPKKGYRLTGVLRIAKEQEPRTKRATKLPYFRSFLKAAVLLYLLSTVAYFIHGSFYQPTSVAKRYVPLVASIMPRPVTVHSAAKKFSQVWTDNKTKHPAIILKEKDTLNNQGLTAPADNPPPTLSASTQTKFYHLSDTTARMITALDYQVTTTLSLSTTLN
jgi:DNA-binding winged helix-turn-helix (wHTH) protein